jgi:hypothetical protein
MGQTRWPKVQRGAHGKWIKPNRGGKPLTTCAAQSEVIRARFPQRVAALSFRGYYDSE